MRFLLKCSEITAETTSDNFSKRALNILCKVTGNGLRHSWRHLCKHVSANFWRQSIKFLRVEKGWNVDRM